MDLDAGNDIDDSALNENYVSITPIQYELTNHAFLEELHKWNIQPLATKQF